MAKRREAPSDGGQAFPMQEDSIGDCHYGMSLRDYFAAAALPAVLAARMALATQSPLVPREDAGDMNQESIAEECYELADAMLAERERAR